MILVLIRFGKKIKFLSIKHYFKNVEQTLEKN